MTNFRDCSNCLTLKFFQTFGMPETFRDAFGVTMACHRRPVQIILLGDLLSESAKYPKFQSPPDWRFQIVPAASLDDIVKESGANKKR